MSQEMKDRFEAAEPAKKKLDKIGGQVKKAEQKLLKSDSLVFTFLRSVVSSQAASWVDLGLGFILFSFLDLQPWLSSGLGAIAGGVINCIINYHFTFHASQLPWRSVVVKYVMVWIGSIVLNSSGTELLYALFSSWDWLKNLGFRPDGYYAAARLLASLLVSWFWNFLLQRNFVYRATKFDSTAIRISKIFLPVKTPSLKK